jgi:hypothetical protein
MTTDNKNYDQVLNDLDRDEDIVDEEEYYSREEDLESRDDYDDELINPDDDDEWDEMWGR